MLQELRAITRIAALVLAGAALFGGALVWPSGASAALISVGACSGLACSVSQIGVSSPSPFADVGTIGVFTVTGTATATTDALASDFASQTIQISLITGGVLTVAFTAQDLLGPNGTHTWVSGFTSNEQTAKTHSVTESTYVDDGNGKFTTTIPLSNSGPITSSGPEALPLMNATATTTAPFSVTELYKISLIGGCSADTPCTANLTIDLASLAIPEPATLALLGLGLVGLGMARRKRR